MLLLKKSLIVAFTCAAFAGISQVSITQDISTENGKLKIHVEKEEKGKKEIFDKTYDTKGMSENERQALIDHVTDSLTASSGKNMKMRVKVDRNQNDVVIEDRITSNPNKNKKKIIIKKDGKTIRKSDDLTENDMEKNIDIDIDEDFDIDIDMNGQDFDFKDLQNKMGDLGKTLQFKFDEFGPMMKKFEGEMEPKFREFSRKFDFEKNTKSSKTVKNLNAYPNKPNNNKLNVEFTAPEKGNVTITVTDITGKEIGKEKIADFTGEYFGQVDLKSSAKGTIFVTVVQGEDGNVKRVVLE